MVKPGAAAEAAAEEAAAASVSEWKTDFDSIQFYFNWLFLILEN